MATGYVLYNNLAGTQEDHLAVDRLKEMLDIPLSLIDITRVTSYHAFFRGMEKDDVVIISGGDGTLNRFVNDIRGIDIPCEIRYFPNGTHNRFAQSLGRGKGCLPFSINREIADLPTVIAEGREYRFLHAVGFGERKYSGPARAVVTVDGKTVTYQKAWLATARWGKQLSVMLYHNVGRLRAWLTIPALLHVEKMSSSRREAVLCGREITVHWEFPCCLMIDGERMPQVSSYTVRTGGAV